MFSWKYTITLIFSFVLIQGCASYTKLSNTERIVTIKNAVDEEINYLEKFDDRTNEWFRAVCGNSNHFGNLVECANNTRFTDASKAKIYAMMNDNGNDLNNQNSNSSNENENSNEPEDEGGEDEDEGGEDDEDPPDGMNGQGDDDGDEDDEDEGW